MRRFAFVVFGAGSLALAGQALAEDSTTTLEASATTQEAIAVVCSQGLSFGVLAVKKDGAGADVSVNHAVGATAQSTSDANVLPISGSGSGVCTVTGEDGADATATLAATGASFSVDATSDVGTLTPVSLENGGASLSADVTLNKAAGISDEDLYVGGTLTIPAGHAATGLQYVATIELVVTD